MRIKRYVRYAWAIEYIESSCDPVFVVDESQPAFRYFLCKTRAEARRWCASGNNDASISETKCRYRPVKVRETIEIIGR